MDRVDCIVIGAGVIGLALARELAIPRARGGAAGGGGPRRHEHQFQQQRGHPFGHLLPGRLPQGPAIHPPNDAMKIPNSGERAVQEGFHERGFIPPGMERAPLAADH